MLTSVTSGLGDPIPGPKRRFNRDGCRPGSIRIPIKHLRLLRGKFIGIPVKILKDDGCNTSVVSRLFVKKHENLLNVVNEKMIVNHSCNGQTEEVSQVV
jgi:hypothetical protein